MAKNIRLNSTNYFIIKVPNKRELPQIVFNHLSDTDLQDFIDLYKNLLQNQFIFYLLIPRLHQIILYVSETTF